MFTVLFILVWLDAVAAFYYAGVGLRDGSPQPTPTHTDPLRDGGHIVYIPHAQKALIDFLQTTMFVGIPLVMGGALVLHFFMGVKMFRNVPTLEEWKKQRFGR